VFIKTKKGGVIREEGGLISEGADKKKGDAIGRFSGRRPEKKKKNHIIRKSLKKEKKRPYRRCRRR